MSKNRLVLLGFIFSLAACRNAVDESEAAMGTTADIPQPVRQKFVDILKYYDLPALVSGYSTSSDENYYTTGVRRVGNPTLATLNDKFHLGSCTKAMTATLVAYFVEKGELKWSSTVSEIFPEYANLIDPSFRDLRIETLTSHRSGLPTEIRNSLNGTENLEKILAMPPMEGRSASVKLALSRPQSVAPNTSYNYSNMNYVIAGAMLEKISGKSTEDLLSQHIFRPLGMTSCGFGPVGTTTELSQPRAHQRNGQTPIPIEPTAKADNPPFMTPAGRVHCNAKDWMKFLRLHVNGFNGRDSAVLKGSSFGKLYQRPGSQNYTYGGWVREEKEWAGGVTLSHEGTNLANYAVTWIAPLKGQAYLALTNVGDAHEPTDKAIYQFVQMINK